MELTNMPVIPGRVFHPNSQSLLDTADQARRRKYGPKGAHPFQPSYFPQNLGDVTEDKLGVFSLMIGVPD